MAYDLKYDQLLRAIQCGEEGDAIALFERKLFDVNQGIRYLFEDGKRFNVTPLYWAVRHNCPEVCKYLLSKGARPYATMVYEYYPLHEACNRGYDKVVQEFVSARCEIDVVNSDSDTPLHVACMRGHIQCVHILLRAGSDTALRNKLGHTPLQCAVYHDRNDLVELFKAHNKGIASHQHTYNQPNTVGALTLAATGTKVQRSHSFNAPATTSSRAQQQKGSVHSRLRSSPRPQSYYEADSTAALVIGQPLLSTLPNQPMSLSSSIASRQSQSLQGLSGLLSYPTISTQQSYSSSSPESPVEKDAPVSQTQSLRAANPPPQQPARSNHEEMSGSQAYSKSDDFGGKYAEFIPSGGRKPETGEVGVGAGSQSAPCPFPSLGGVQKETSERSAPLQKHSHPLSASKRSSVTNRRGEKLLYERMSHPEFHIAKQEIPIANRAKSAIDVFYGNPVKGSEGKRAPIVSSTRERINSLSAVLCDTLEFDFSPSQHHSSLKPSASLHPLLGSLRASLATLAHQFGLSLDHHKCLSDLTLSPSHPPSSFSTPDSSLCPLQSYQEVEYDIVEGPLESRLWWDENRMELYATLVYKVQLRDALMQLRSQLNQGDIALLKVRVRLGSNIAESSQPSSISIGQPADLLPEAAVLQELPHHPNIVSILYHCRGRTERFRQHLAQIQSEFHTTACDTSQSRSNSTLVNEFRSGTTECPHNGTEGGHTTYNPTTTGSFLFQALPGVSIEKFFHDFLQSQPSESNMEERILPLLSQLLLAVAHLQRNAVAHCAISSQNVYVSEKGQKVMLGDFGQALSLRPKNLEVLQKSIRKLKASEARKLSPEAEQSLLSGEVEESSYPVSNIERVFCMSDSYAVGALFYDLFLGKQRALAESETTPFIRSLSFKCNHLLQKLVAHDPSDRFSALQGAVSCFVLLFGPRTSEICGPNDCLRWLVSESLELYLNPVLRDSSLSSNRESYMRRLHYTYLISANPDLVWNSCKFFNNN